MTSPSALLLATLPWILLQGPPADLPRRAIPPDGLAARMAEEVAAGFSGAVLLVRGGKVVLDQGYGLANREKKLSVRPDTIFAIGSTPIDFTRAGILLLVQQEFVGLEDELGVFFSEASGFEIYYTVGDQEQMLVVTNSSESRARRRALEALALDLAARVAAK